MSKKDQKPGEVGYDAFKDHFGWSYPKVPKQKSPIKGEVQRQISGKQVLYKEQ